MRSARNRSRQRSAGTAALARGRSARRTALGLAAVVALVVALGATPALADAVGPALTGLTPADAASVQGAFTFSVHAQDGDGVDGASGTLTIDGVPYALTVSQGYWTGDGCSSWWVTTPNDADFTANISGLLPGEHDVVFTVADDLGNLTTSATTFEETGSGPLVTSADPGDGDSAFGTATMSIHAIDPDEIDLASAVLEIDGVAYALTSSHPGSWVGSGCSTRWVEDETQADFSADMSGIPNGIHDVEFRVSDAAGTVSLTTWQFDTIGDPDAPVVASVWPSSGTTVTTAAPTLTASFTDNDVIDTSSIALTLDGVPRTPLHVDVQAPGAVDVSWFVYGLSEGLHSARVEVADVAGNTASEIWTFTVEAPPVFGSGVPTGIVAPVSTVSVDVADGNNALDAASLVVEFDGAPVPATLAPPAAQSGVVSADVDASADGPHSVDVTIADVAGNPATTSWTFTVDAAGPAFSPGTAEPTSGTVVPTSIVPIRAEFDDLSAMDVAATQVLVDGSPVAATTAFGGHWEGTGCASWWVEDNSVLIVTASPQLHNGAHDVEVTVADVVGNHSTASWSFEVEEYPAIEDVAPSAGTTTLETTVPVSATVSAFDGIVPASVTIEAREANAGSEPGAWVDLGATYDTATDLARAELVTPLNETRFELRFSASQIAGLSTTVTTDVYVGTSAAAMPATADCGACHTTILATHPMRDCTACHGSDCYECHPGTHTTALLEPYCAQCHDHEDSEAVSQQHRSTSAPDCYPCHAVALTTEHAGRTDTGGAPIDCVTCHGSADTTVTAAIAAGDTECIACHSVGTSGHESLHESEGWDPVCEMCHFGNLVTEHLENEQTQPTLLTCDSCHESTDPTVVGAIGAGETDCTACHDGHGDLAAVHSHEETGTFPATGLNGPCTQCHFDSIVTEHALFSLACLTCHEVGGPAENLPGPWDGTCEACHPTAHDAYTTVHVPHGVDCEACHGANLDVTWHPTCANLAPGDVNATGSCHVSPAQRPTTVWCRDCHPDE